MKEVTVVRSKNEVIVFADGQAYISQRRAAELCGVRQNSVVHFFKGKQDISQGVKAKDLAVVVQYYAKQGKTEAVMTLMATRRPSNLN